jgi:glucoamylase
MAGGPAPLPRAQAVQSWTSGAKDLVMTALGTSGWTDFRRNQSMTLTYSQAGPGVVALTGELAAGSGLLALGFGDSQGAARSAARASLDAGYDAMAAAFTRGWQAWLADLTLPGPAAPPGLADALRESAAVLRTHADHTVTGAYVAGLAIPWWPRCFFVSRVPSAFDPQAAVQLDEVAFPLLLAGKLDELGVPLPDGAANAITSAAGYLARSGPVSSLDVDRWEENPGASPFTIGLEIVAMLVAATRLTGPDRALALALADNWNERLEEFTYVSGDEIDRAFGTDGHYVRIGLSGGGRVDVRNQPQGTQPVVAAALVGLEFGYLPRLGLRDPADKRVTDTLAIVEAMLGADTPGGRAYHRYDIDGYGECLDGSGWPVRTFGTGRPWPLLAAPGPGTLRLSGDHAGRLAAGGR